jgi:hypothetical protein
MSWRRRVFIAIAAAALLGGSAAGAQVERQPLNSNGTKLPKSHLDTREGPEHLPDGRVDGPIKQPMETPVDLPPTPTAEGKVTPGATAPLMNRKKSAAIPDDDLGNQIGPAIRFGPGSQKASGQLTGSGSFGSQPLIEKFKALLADEAKAKKPHRKNRQRVKKHHPLDRYQ